MSNELKTRKSGRKRKDRVSLFFFWGGGYFNVHQTKKATLNLNKYKRNKNNTRYVQFYFIYILGYFHSLLSVINKIRS